MRRIGKKSRGEGQWEGAWSSDNKWLFFLYLSLSLLLFCVFLFFLFFRISSFGGEMKKNFGGYSF